jgi:hypothetical protein
VSPLYRAISDSGLTHRHVAKKVRALLTNDKELAVCAPQVAGYCLTYKGWVSLISSWKDGVYKLIRSIKAKFDVDNVKEITWDHHAFDALVLQPDVKKVILSFVQVQLSEKDKFDDIINGKGKGIIVLFQVRRIHTVCHLSMLLT